MYAFKSVRSIFPCYTLYPNALKTDTENAASLKKRELIPPKSMLLI